MSYRRPAAVLAGLAVALGMLAGAAWAAGFSLPFSGDGTTINGCYSSGGALKVLTPSSSNCPSGFTPIHWNVTGPQGAQGPQGPVGNQGPQGPVGPDGSQGPAGPAGASGTSVAYYASNERIIEGHYDDGPQALVGLSNLPNGVYDVSVSVFNKTEGKNDVRCGIGREVAKDDGGLSQVRVDVRGNTDVYEPFIVPDGQVVTLTLVINVSRDVQPDLLVQCTTIGGLVFDHHGAVAGAMTAIKSDSVG